MMPKTGILLVTYGAPDTLDNIGPFMRNLMGREPSQEAIDAARIRYLTVGGTSPLPARAERLAAALERALSDLPPAPETDESMEERFGLTDDSPTRAASGVRWPVAVGMLHWTPTIAEAVDRLYRAGADRIVWLSLSPFESSVTTGPFRDAVNAAADDAGIEAVEVSGYHETPQYAMWLGDSCNAALGELPRDARSAVVFTAHSLPVSDVGEGSYPLAMETLARNVARFAGLGEEEPASIESAFGLKTTGGMESIPWMVAYQSEGARGGQWLGPRLDETLDALVDAGIDAVAVCPIGFVLDHLETAYDLDVEAADRMLSSDHEFSRAAVPNDDGQFVGILDALIRPHLG